MPEAVKEPKEPTHAYVGYDIGDRAVMLFVDASETRRECAKACSRVLRKGGRIERMPIEEARKLRFGT